MNLRMQCCDPLSSPTFRFHSICLLLCLLLLSATALSQFPPDPELLAAIQKIRAIDNHSHASPARTPDPAESERPDPIGKPSFEYPVRLRLTNPEYAEAWRALYGYTYRDMSPDHAREARRTKLRIMKEKGTEYPVWVLDQAGIDIALVNLPHLGPGQNARRYLWVPSADRFLFPFTRGEESIAWLHEEVGLDSLPASLQGYVGKMQEVLERWKKSGAVAIKFTTAYSRPLNFALVPAEEADAIFARHHQDRNPSAEDYTALQDFLFHSLAREAGRIGLAVHIHTGVGAAPYYNLNGSNPLLLETQFNDEELRKTTFVMIHGGWPFEREAGVMLMKPNVYADFSAQTFLRSTEALSEALRTWLEWYPEKVLFGTDAYPEDTPLSNWEERLWLATRSARQALALALTRMIQAGQITRPRAEQLARMVLHDNATKLYGLEQR